MALACDAEPERTAYVPPGPLGDAGADDHAEDDDDGDSTEGGGGLGDCAEVEVRIEAITPTIVVMVDRSYSMTEDFDGAERWGAVYRTLMHPEDGVISRLQSQASFGLTLYTSKNGDENPECPILTEVAPALNNAEAIDELLTSKNPLDEGPAGESLEIVAQQLAEIESDGPRAIVLATDGEPDTCAQPNPDQGQAIALQAAGYAYELGISTFVVSVGDDVTEEHLQQMANVGVGRASDASDPAPYYKALSPDELVDAFHAVVSELVRCDAKIEGIVELDKACTGTVTLDGKSLDCGDDFELADESTLLLKGSACESLKSGGQHTLEGTWPCDAINVP